MMVKRLIQAAAIVALLTGTASAQFAPTFPIGGEDKTLTPEEAARQKMLDNAYNSANKKIPDKKPPADPWGTVRAAPATASKNKP